MAKNIDMTDIMKSPGLQLIVAGMAGLVEQEGKTPREVYELLDSLKGSLWSSLNELKK